MEKSVAEKVLALMLEYSGKLDASVQLVKDTCTEQEFRHYRRAIGKIMGEMGVEIMWPIFKEHPELEPEEFKPKNNTAAPAATSKNTAPQIGSSPPRHRARMTKKRR
jgi:hypothetical protein